MDVELSTVLKWVVTILVTGFIAQFGKMLAKYIVEKIKSRKSGVSAVRDERGSAAGGPDYEVTGMVQGRTTHKELLKAEKKRMKAEQKRAKKAESGT
ncbi:MAG TPA: hypothetical protein PK544_12720 [Spirochaetota bacterium]|nr:hypothetical protein [Spirochaetota bacterium]HPJ40069.1 hypothetical protein [Spirochaetota bacterium]HPQ54290.1 hypothetical protein [Spirochaetota bacterium]